MKVLKVVLIALVMAFTFGTARAQVSIHARVGQRPVHRHVVVVQRPVYHRYYYHHRWYRRDYYRHHYRHY